MTTTVGVRRVQSALLARGTPLIWARDLPADHPAFFAGSRAILAGALTGERARSLDVRPDEPLSDDERMAIATAFDRRCPPAGSTWAEAVLAAADNHPSHPPTEVPR